MWAAVFQAVVLGLGHGARPTAATLLQHAWASVTGCLHNAVSVTVDDDDGAGGDGWKLSADVYAAAPIPATTVALETIFALTVPPPSSAWRVALDGGDLTTERADLIAALNAALTVGSNGAIEIFHVVRVGGDFSPILCCDHRTFEYLVPLAAFHPPSSQTVAAATSHSNQHGGTMVEEEAGLWRCRVSARVRPGTRFVLRAYPSRRAPGVRTGMVGESLDSIQCGDIVWVDRKLTVPPSPSSSSDCGGDGAPDTIVYSRLVSIVGSYDEQQHQQQHTTGRRRYHIRGWVFTVTDEVILLKDAETKTVEPLALLPLLLEEASLSEGSESSRSIDDDSHTGSGWLLRSAALNLRAAMQSLIPAGTGSRGGGTGTPGLGFPRWHNYASAASYHSFHGENQAPPPLDSANESATTGRLLSCRVVGVLYPSSPLDCIDTNAAIADPSCKVSAQSEHPVLVLSFCAKRFQRGQIPRLIGALLATVHPQLTLTLLLRGRSLATMLDGGDAAAENSTGAVRAAVTASMVARAWLRGSLEREVSYCGGSDGGSRLPTPPGEITAALMYQRTAHYARYEGKCKLLRSSSPSCPTPLTPLSPSHWRQQSLATDDNHSNAMTTEAPGTTIETCGGVANARKQQQHLMAAVLNRLGNFRHTNFMPRSARRGAADGGAAEARIVGSRCVMAAASAIAQLTSWAGRDGALRQRLHFNSEGRYGEQQWQPPSPPPPPRGLAFEHALRSRWPWPTRPHASSDNNNNNISSNTIDKVIRGRTKAVGSEKNCWHWSRSSWESLRHTFGSTMDLRSSTSTMSSTTLAASVTDAGRCAVSASVTAVGDEPGWVGGVFVSHDHWLIVGQQLTVDDTVAAVETDLAGAGGAGLQQRRRRTTLVQIQHQLDGVNTNASDIGSSANLSSTASGTLAAVEICGATLAMRTTEVQRRHYFAKGSTGGSSGERRPAAVSVAVCVSAPATAVLLVTDCDFPALVSVTELSPLPTAAVEPIIPGPQRELLEQQFSSVRLSQPYY